MKKHIFTAVTAAAALLSLCSCTSGKSSTVSPSSAFVTTASPSSVVVTKVSRGDTQYDSGTYSGSDFSLYADPYLWAYRTDDNDTCDLRMITDGGFVTCGISIYTSDDDYGGKSARDIVMSNDNPSVVLTGALSTVPITFYYYEWEMNEDTHARTYFGDLDGRYLCIYAESTNFGYVDGKIAELLSGLKLNG